MVRYEIHSDEKDQDDHVIGISLQRKGSMITVRGSDKDGEDWNLVSFTAEGRLILHNYVDKDMGLQLDDHQRIQVTKE